MSLRLKSLLIFSAAILGLFAIVLGLVRTLIENQFNTIEYETMIKHAGHLTNELDEEIDPLISTVGDWAPWDDLYNYVNGSNPTFPENNLHESDLANLRIDFFAIWRQDGTLLRMTAIAGNLEKEGLSEEDILEGIRSQKLVPQQDISRPASGYMRVGNRIVMIAALPIVRSGRTGAPAGTLVGGRVFGPDEIKGIEEFADFTFKFILPSEGHPYPRLETMGTPARPEVRIIDRQHIATAIPIFDTRGRFIATAELTSSRLLHLQATKTIQIFLIALASSAGILLFIVWYLLDAYVIHPVRRLSRKLTEAAIHGELPSELGLDGGDELSDLARCIEDLARSLALAEANYRSVVEDQLDLIFRYQPDGHITFVNTAMCRYFNRRRDDLIYSNARDLVAPEDAEQVATALARLSVHEPVVTIDHRVRTPEGNLAWLRRTDRAIYSDEGQLRELQCVASDITQTQLAHVRLEASERRYRRLFETATDGILIVRRAGRIISDANPEFCRLTECSRLLIIERPLELLPPFRNSKTLRSLARLFIDTEAIPGVEITIPAEDGIQRYLEVTAGVYVAGNEEIVQLNFRDISIRRRADEELRQLSGHLLRLQDEERRRIARELHDSTAQNLSALQMAVTQLEPRLPAKDASAHDALNEIRTLCDLSSKEIRTISYLLHPPLLDEVGLLFALRWYVDGFMTRTEKTVRLDVPESLDRLPPDIETTIFRVVQEGLSNIHRHSGSRRAWIRLALENNVLELVIRDEGHGLSPGAAGPDGPYPPGYPVLGVGIAGMRERLRQFNGSLEIESNGSGTTVRAILPLHREDPKDD